MQFYVYFIDDNGMLDTIKDPYLVPRLGDTVRLKDRYGVLRPYMVCDVALDLLHTMATVQVSVLNT